MLLKIREAINTLIKLKILDKSRKLSRALDETAAVELFNQMMEDVPIKIARKMPDDILTLVEDCSEWKPSREGDSVEIVDNDLSDDFADADQTGLSDTELEQMDAPPQTKGRQVEIPADESDDVLPPLFDKGVSNKKLETYVNDLSTDGIVAEIPRHVEHINVSQKRKKPIVVPEDLDFADAREILIAAVESSLVTEQTLHSFTIYLNNRIVGMQIDEKDSLPDSEVIEVSVKDKAKTKRKAKHDTDFERQAAEAKKIADKNAAAATETTNGKKEKKKAAVDKVLNQATSTPDPKQLETVIEHVIRKVLRSEISSIMTSIQKSFDEG